MTGPGAGARLFRDTQSVGIVRASAHSNTGWNASRSSSA